MIIFMIDYILNIMNKNKQFFVIKALVAPTYAKPSFNSPQVTEAVSGEIVQIFDIKDEWLFIEQTDGYKSWVNNFYGEIDNNPIELNYIVTDFHSLPFGIRLSIIDGQYFTVNGDSYIPKSKPRNVKESFKHNLILENAKKLIGCPYRWGGKTSMGFDCSGFVQSVFFSAGLLLPRDSSEQFEYFSKNIIKAEEVEPGDLQFFGKNGKITHVGISIGESGIIHCQGWVKEESLSKDKKIFNQKLLDMYMYSCSIKLNLEC